MGFLATLTAGLVFFVLGMLARPGKPHPDSPTKAH